MRLQFSHLYPELPRHWLGLFHTFEKGCHEVNDGIDDTPQQAFPIFGCSPDDIWDSCPRDGATPSIHNFMGYNDDICLYQWTPGQVAAMLANYDAYRVPEEKRSLDSPPILLERGLASDPPRSILLQDLWVYSLAGIFDATMEVSCNATASTGDIDLFLNWDGSLDHFECVSDSPYSNETCSMVNTNTIQTSAFAMIFGATTATDMVGTCDTRPLRDDSS